MLGALYAIVPLTVLALVLVVGMSGCGLPVGGIDGPGDEGTPSYREQIKSHASLVAYWRLNESSGLVAFDSATAGIHDGAYMTGPLPAAPFSAAAPGDLAFNQPPALVSSESESLSVQVNGGRVEVPLTAELQTPQFTVVAWVLPQWDPDSEEAGNVRTVMTTRESPDTGEKGWSLTANASSQWEVNICDGTTHQTLADGDVFKTAVTFVAATYDGATVSLFANAGNLGSPVTAAYVPSTVPNLYIGEGRPDLPEPQFPFNGLIGEVAYFNTALTQQELTDLLLASMGSG